MKRPETGLEKPVSPPTSRVTAVARAPSRNTDRGATLCCESEGNPHRRSDRATSTGHAGVIRPERVEQQGVNPKDGDLRLARVKPCESSVEARRGGDVQISPQSWV